MEGGMLNSLKLDNTISKPMLKLSIESLGAKLRLKRNVVVGWDFCNVL